MRQRETGPLGRLRGYVGELNGFLHRRRLRQTPLVRVYWPDGTVKTLTADLEQAQAFLALAEELVDLTEQHGNRSPELE